MAALVLAAYLEGVDPKLLTAICKVESGHQATEINIMDGGSPSIGLCQIKLGTARVVGFRGQWTDLLNPYVNARYAAKYLAKQTRRCNSVDLGIRAYNSGRCSRGSHIYLSRVKEAYARL